jgi:hypothetical protein
VVLLLLNVFPSGETTRFRDQPEELRWRILLTGAPLSASSAPGQGRSSPPSVASESSGSGTPKMGSSPSPLLLNGLTKSCHPPEFLHATSSSTPTTVPIVVHCGSCTQQKAERRKNTEERVLRPPPIFLDSIAEAVGAATVLLRSPFSASRLLYGTLGYNLYIRLALLLHRSAWSMANNYR